MRIVYYIAEAEAPCPSCSDQRRFTGPALALKRGTAKGRKGNAQKVTFKSLKSDLKVTFK